jgi:hypothetical protein
MHETRCTEENPVPLNASRMVIPKEMDIKQDNQNNNQVNNENKQENKDVIPQISHIEQNINNINNYDINELNNYEEIPKQFLCEICNKMIDEKDKADHILCHNLEKEQQNEMINNGNNDINDLYGYSQKEIEEQRKIERQIERNKKKNIRENNNNHNLNNNNNTNRRELNNRNNNLNIRNTNNIHIRPSNINNLNNRRINSNNNINRNFQINRNNQINRGPIISIRQSGPNGNRITTHIYQDTEIPSEINYLSSLNRRINNNNNANNIFRNFHSRRHGNNIFNQFENMFEEMLNNGPHPRPTDKELFNEFPETKIEDVNKLDPEKKNCVICLEDFKSGEKATLLPCVHLFHKNCIKSWLKSKNMCPICKFELTRDNINKQNNKF